MGDLRRYNATSAPEALGRHFRRAVVVAGPGAGKSTLLCRVAAACAADGVPVLKASARSVAKRMSAGQGFEEALFDDALDGAPVPAALARRVRGLPWTVLLDRLDESGQGQGGVIKGLKALAAGRPDCRSRLEVLRKDPVNEVRERAAKMLRALREMRSDR